MIKTTNEFERGSGWVDVHDDALMISLGIHLPNVTPRDPSIWTKTSKEKKEIKKMRLRHKHDYLTKGIIDRRSIPVYGKLIVQINGKNVAKTTFSYNCGQSDIPNILRKFVNDNDKSIIRYYTWNGKKYEVGTLPFWYR